MNCILKEFDTLQDTENFINECLKNHGSMANLQLVPYTMEPNVPKYLVLFYQYEDIDR